MSVSNVSNVSNAQTYQTTSEKANTSSNTNNSTTTDTKTDTAAVYEPNKNTENVDNTKKTYKRDDNLIQQLKADAERRTEQLRSLVEKMLQGQFGANSTMEDIFLKIQSGDFSVDQKTVDEAKASIADDGYWGVEQTSDRMVSFAKGLTGGDPDKIDEMVAAFQKGYEQATGMMKDVPDITKRTYEATMQKFEDWRNEGK